MKPGTESQTAVIVCMARAAAHGRTVVPRFDDPTALALLPAEARERVERARAGTAAASSKEKVQRTFIERRGSMMALRTVAVDDAVRARAGDNGQLVILGAGLDGRAWRMPELRDAIVFEVDHPDSQRTKRERAATLDAAGGDAAGSGGGRGRGGGAREVRFVPVDFARDRLDDALEAARHDATKPTTWIWEGVVMYLERDAIEATLATIAKRSAPGSRLVIVYNAPTWMARAVGLMLRRVGEPFRSAFRADEMRRLLARHGFDVDTDEDIPAIARRLAPSLARDVRLMRHARVVVADRGRVADRGSVAHR